MYQYKITVNDAAGPILDKLPHAQWSHIAEVIEERGGHATLYSRLITDTAILPLLTDPKGYITVKDTVFCPWEIIAEIIGS